MKHGSLFSGIGGFDYAASIMGWENVFHCEWNTFGQQVLKYHFPNSICHDDITKTDFSIYRGRIDILSGGFPCQPYSMAGKRLGKDDERHLWPEMLRVIREISPKWIVGENVFGIVNWSGGLVFEEVQADLEREGYEVQSYILPAAGVDAPHKRDRVWFVGYAKHNGRSASKVRRDEQESSFKAGENEVREFERADSVQSSSGIVTNRNGARLQAKRSELKATGTEQYGKLVKNASNTDSFRLEQCKDTREVGTGQSKVGREGCESTNAAKANSEVTDASNTSHTRLQGGEEFGSVRGCGEKSHEQPSRCFFSNWQNFPTQPPVCVGNDGISARLDTSAISFPKWRNESIKAAGNAVVPQVVLQIFKAIQEYENLNFC